MSIFFIVKAPQVAGPQPQSVTETNKAEVTSYAISSIAYAATLQAQSVTETNKAEVTSYAINSITYA
jgi:hypothetical protein